MQNKFYKKIKEVPTKKYWIDTDCDCITWSYSNVINNNIKSFDSKKECEQFFKRASRKSYNRVGGYNKTNTMIDIKKLTDKDINRKVVYKPHPGKVEEGRITSFNATWIFVDYQNVGRGQATPANKLEFVSPLNNKK